MDVYPSLTYRDVEAALAILTATSRAECAMPASNTGTAGFWSNLIFLVSCTVAISGRVGCMSPSRIRTRTSRVRVTPARRCSAIRMMPSTARCAATALATRKAICGASARTVRAVDPGPPFRAETSRCLDHGVAQVGRLRLLDNAGGLEPDVPAGVVEQPRARAEQDRNEVDPDLVHEAGAQQLSADAGAEHVDVLLAGDRGGGGHGLLRTADEGVHATVGHVIGYVVGHDDRRGARLGAGAVGAPPRNGQIVGTAAGDAGADGVLAVGVHVAAALVRAEGPLVQDLAAVAHRFVGSCARRGDVAVEGQADLESDAAHGVWFPSWPAGAPAVAGMRV